MPQLICRACHRHLQGRVSKRISRLQTLRRCFSAPSHPDPKNKTAIETLSWYWDTTPPSPSDLASATTFFETHPPRKLWTATEWRKQNEPVDGTLIPEVAFLGRSNVGKSSLLNALLLSPKLNHVGARPGKTKTMHAWGLAASNPLTGGALKGHNGDTAVKLAVLDMPGYGHASHGDWGAEIITYLKQRKHLKRAFVLLDTMHGIKESDLKILQMLRRYAISHQIIASKCDRLGKSASNKAALKEAMQKMRNAVQPNGTSGFVGLGEIITVGALGDGRKNDDVKADRMLGIEEVRCAVLVAAGLETSKSKNLITPKLTESDRQPRTPLNHSSPRLVLSNLPALSYLNEALPTSTFSHPLSSRPSTYQAHEASRAPRSLSPGATIRSQSVRRVSPTPKTARFAPKLQSQPAVQSRKDPSTSASQKGTAADPSSSFSSSSPPPPPPPPPPLPPPPPPKKPSFKNIGYGLADLEAMTASPRRGDNNNNHNNTKNRSKRGTAHSKSNRSGPPPPPRMATTTTTTTKRLRNSSSSSNSSSSAAAARTVMLKRRAHVT